MDDILDVTITPLHEVDISEVQAVYDASISALTDPGAVRPDAPDFFEWVFSVGGEMLGLRLDNRLVAYGVLRMPKATKNDWDGMERAVPAEAKFAVLDGSAVHPEFWSRGLHRRAIDERTQMAAGWGVDYVVALAGPRNIPSMRNLTRSGFAIAGLARKPYGWRYVHARSVKTPEVSEGPFHWERAEDVDASQARFSRGEVASLAKGDPELGSMIRFQRRHSQSHLARGTD